MNRNALLFVGLLAGTIGCEERSRDVEASSGSAPASQPEARLASDMRPKAEDYVRIVDSCMKYSPPPEMTVFTQDYDEGVQLRLEPPNANYRIPDVGRTTAFAPPEWEALNPTPPLSGVHRAGAYGSLIFMHARKTPADQELLTVVMWPHYSGSHGLRVTLIELDRNDPGKRREVSTFAVPRGVLLAREDSQPALPIAQKLRFFAGQPNPHDESAWTIRYTVNGLPGVIQMKLAGEPELEKHVWPMRHQGNVPMQISVQRPNGTLWTH